MKYVIKLQIFLLLNLFAPGLSANNVSSDKFTKAMAAMPDTREKADKLNNYADELLKTNPSVANCKIAEKYALQAAKISEKLEYNVGLARSYEQLAFIYKTLDYQLKYYRYRNKAAAVDRGGELKRQQEKIKQQKEETEKIKREIDELSNNDSANKELIVKKEQELLLKEKDLNETSGKLDLITEQAERLAISNRILMQDKKIKDLELRRQRTQKYLSLFLVATFLILAIVLFKLYKIKHRTAVELAEKNEIITNEKRRSDELLLNILPSDTAEELKLNGKAIARDYEMVTVLFTDFKDFTKISEKLTPKDLVDEIDFCFCAFDNIIEKHGIEKIKTIGDAYLCAYGLSKNTLAGSKHNASVVVDAALEIIKFMEELQKKRAAEGKPFFSVRAGINSGPLVAGVVGRKKFAYDIWGDTVNTAARMEQSSEPGKINISSATYTMIKNKYNTIHRGKIEAKNKGFINMYFVEDKKA